ncbi:hypothetical protein AcW1_008115 [Taiwanofungus camphoratus]|nr:hypothetical protein AcW1_008115 [Antrodia cinnamomea]
MVHVRLNERETNPNPHINFIAALPMADAISQENARQLLRALAAQVRPVMKAHGFSVNSFEEYEYNKVFAGRNWNAGEVVELVLRGGTGAFLPISWLMSTLCHELAHIKHMNHGPAFQALWTKLRTEVRELQSKGYYGDGYWSSGTRLVDSTRVSGQISSAGDLPEYMCGGAHTRARPTSLRRRRNRQPAGPSNHTGAQTSKRRKAGSRVTAQGTFKGEGRALNDDASDKDQKKAGSGFRKKAGSKRAREERAMAAERRIRALQRQAGPSTVSSPQPTQDEDEAESSDDEEVRETDQDRRQTMLDTMEQSDLEGLKASRTDFSSDFVFPSSNAGLLSSQTHLEVSSHNDFDNLPIRQDDPDDIQILSESGSVSTSRHRGTAASSPSIQGNSRKKLSPEKAHRQMELEDWLRPEADASGPRRRQQLSYGALVQNEVKMRKKESLGMAGGGQRLGGKRQAGDSDIVARSDPLHTQRHNEEGEWTCLVCTL